MPNKQQLKIFENIMAYCLSLYQSNNEACFFWFQLAECGVATVLFMKMVKRVLNTTELNIVSVTNV